jgi:glutamine amidotransferase
MGVVGRVEREHVSSFRKLAHKGKIKQSKEKDDYRHHVDGWGIGFFRDGGARVYKEGTDAFYSYGYELVTREILTYPPEAAVFHIRRASDKNTISDAKAHPFGGSQFNKEWLFCHNGGVDSYDTMKMRGMIDSEFLFDTLLDSMKTTDFDGVFAAAQAMRKETLSRFGGYSAINFMITDGKVLYAYRDASRDADYFELFVAKNGEGTLVASEEIDKKLQWSPIEVGEMVKVTKDGFERKR